MGWKDERDNKCPCKGCDKREPGTGCHDRCEAYQKWKASEQELKEEAKRLNGINTMSDAKKKALWRAARYQNHANKSRLGSKE